MCVYAQIPLGEKLFHNGMVTGSDLKMIIIDSFVDEIDLTDIDQVEFWTWLISSLQLCNN